MTRVFYLGAGYTAILLALAGIPLPLLPSTPFALLACFCFSKSSPGLKLRIENSKLFGEALKNWRESRAISYKAKCLATILLLFSVIGVINSPLTGSSKVIGVAIILFVCLIIVTRPNVQMVRRVVPLSSSETLSE